MTGPIDRKASPEIVADAHADRVRPRRPVRRLLAALALLLVGGSLAFLGGFAAFATHIARLTTPTDLPSADAIIVLTGGEKRLTAAVDLLEAGKGKRLLISGVHPKARLSDLRRAMRGCSTAVSTSITPRSTRSAMPKRAPSGSRAITGTR